MNDVNTDKYGIRKAKNESNGNKYFSVGLSIKMTEENKPLIDGYKKLISDVKRKMKISEDVKNVDFITDLLYYVIEHN